MKTSGIIRRVDSLGRIVIPKELRQALGIHTGDSLEVGLTADNHITLTKHSWLKELEAPSTELVRTLYRICGRPAIVADRERVLAAAGFGSLKVSGELITPSLRRVIEGRSVYRGDMGRRVPVMDRHRDVQALISVPIIIHGEPSGCVLLTGTPDADALQQMDTNEKILTALTSVSGSCLSD